MKPKFTIEKFIEKSKKIHSDKYDYSQSNYIGAIKKLKIICKIHGAFFQCPHDHWRGRGCPKCAPLNRIQNKSKSVDKFIFDCIKIHGNEYDYSLVRYKSSHEKIKIICSKHGNFDQMPYAHLNGQKCPKCSNNISKLETEFLDYIKIDKRCYNLPNWKKKPVDGYDPKTNTVYEFLGDYWHGNPKVYKPNDLNKICGISYNKLYNGTLNMLNKLKSLGYNVKYIWEKDWIKFKKGIDNIPKIQIYS